MTMSSIIGTIPANHWPQMYLAKVPSSTSARICSTLPYNCPDSSTLLFKLHKTENLREDFAASLGSGMWWSAGSCGGCDTSKSRHRFIIIFIFIRYFNRGPATLREEPSQINVILQE